MKARGGDVRIVYSPLDAREAGAPASRPPGGLLRRGLRDHRARATPWPCTGRAEGLAELLACSWPTCWCRPPWRRSSSARRASSRACSPRATSARSRATASTRRSPRRYRVPIVVTGFEPVDLLRGVLAAVRQLEAGEARVENAVRAGGAARRATSRRSALIEEVFVVVPTAVARARRDPAERLRACAPRYARLRRGAGLRRRGRRRPSEPRGVPEPGSSCRAGSSPPSARSSARAARPSIRWARPWSRPRGPARPTSITAAPRAAVLATGR